MIRDNGRGITKGYERDKEKLECQKTMEKV